MACDSSGIAGRVEGFARSVDGPNALKPTWLLRDSVSHWAGVQPEHTAFIDSDRSISYGQLAADIDSMCAALFTAGVRRGSNVVIIAPSSIEFAIVLFAGFQLGANTIPLDMMLAEADVQKRLDITRPALVFATTQAHADEAARLGYRVIDVKGETEGFEGFAQFLASGTQQPEAADLPSADAPNPEPGLTIFTSGSTGEPKGVLLSEANLTHANLSFNRALEGNQSDTFITSLPVSHLYGVNGGVLLPMLCGATSVLMRKFSSRGMLDAIQKYKATAINGVPSMYKRMAHAQEEEPRDLSSMRKGTIAGAKCSGLEVYRDVLHCPTRILYGLSECPFICVTCGDDSYDTNVTGVGRFLDTIEPRIIDDDGNPLGQGEEGEIVCKSPGTMIGYLNNPQATLECVDADGWAHTGDIGYVDENGYVQIVGRKVDVINRGGYKVHPGEIERLYSENPNVLECCVQGFPHEELGQQTVLFAEVRRKDTSPQELREWAKGRIAKYKLPDLVIVLDKIPYLPNGKLDKKKMAAIFEADEHKFRTDAERLRMQSS